MSISIDPYHLSHFLWYLFSIPFLFCSVYSSLPPQNLIITSFHLPKMALLIGPRERNFTLPFPSHFSFSTNKISIIAMFIFVIPLLGDTFANELRHIIKLLQPNHSDKLCDTLLFILPVLNWPTLPVIN